MKPTADGMRVRISTYLYLYIETAFRWSLNATFKSKLISAVVIKRLNVNPNLDWYKPTTGMRIRISTLSIETAVRWSLNATFKCKLISAVVIKRLNVNPNLDG